jgi:hypothetical protein
MSTKKPFWQSKTFWVATVIPVALGFIPGAVQWAAANPVELSSFTSVLFILLRIVTKGAVTITDPGTDTPVLGQ